MDDRLRAVRQTGLTEAATPALDRLARLTARVLGADATVVALLDGDRQVFPGQFGLPPVLDEVRATPIEQALWAADAGSELVQIDDVRSSAEQHHPAVAELGIAAYLGAPLLDADGRRLGVLAALGRDARAWTDDDRRTLADLAVAVSSDLQARIASRHATDARREADAARVRLEMISAVSSALLSTMDPALAIERMLEQVTRQFALWAFVYVGQDGNDESSLFVRHRERDVEAIAKELASDPARRLRDMPRTQAVLDGRVPWVRLDASTAREAAGSAGDTGALFRDLGMGPVIVVPMRVDGRITGAFGVFGDADSEFDERDSGLVQDLARRGAMAFENARLFEIERIVARDLQHSLLPDLPDVDHLLVDAVYVAAGTGAEVGGDWYDLVDTGDRIVATIGDVTGHSLDAAAAMGRIQSAMRVFAHDGLDVAAMLDRIDGMHQVLLAPFLATCQAIELTRLDGRWELAVASAGHPPPVVLTPDGRAELLTVARNPLIGIGRRDLQRSIVRHRLPFGSRLYLYTDGLVERRGEPIDQGLARLVKSIRRVGAAPAAMVLEHLEPETSDDAALMIIEMR